MQPYTKFWTVLLLALFGVLPLSAQTPTVHGLFFYSPDCPHCHEVMDNQWPAIADEFGDQLRVLFVDVSNPIGAQLMQTARASMSIESNGVPMLILGEQVLVGSTQIAALAPRAIRLGLAEGGIAAPPIEGVATLLAGVNTEAMIDEERSLNDKLAADPTGNMLALALLFGLGGSLLAGIAPVLRPQLTQALTEDARWPISLASLIGLGIAFALLAGTDGGPVTVLAMILVAVFGTVLLGGVQAKTPAWIAPVVILAGAATAGYMFYVESNALEAVCGMVGDCNAVQSSSYAHFAGIPMGLLGVTGYVALLLLWVLGRITPNRTADILLLGGVLFGTAFSFYLIFLEPFVIGAVCAWCLTSALLMLLTLWTVAPLGWRALLTPPPADNLPPQPILRQI